MSKALLVVVCIVVGIMFAVAYGDLYHKWQEERTFRIFMETLAESYEQDANYYKQLYYDCHFEEELTSPWTNYADK